jgi:hypothetical protein
LLEPRDGLPPVIQDEAALAEAIGRLANGHGPVAVDAERASGYRYGQRAYLVQLRRAGAGTMLIDPIACPDLSGVDAALRDAEAILHAASQDLPCLAEVGFRPRQLFDTELAGRLLGYPRVALGTLVEEVLGFHLEKGHSAADWSVRPLREELLRYAALDVEVLIELRDALAAALVPPRAGCGARALDGQGPDRPGRGPVAAARPARQRDHRRGPGASDQRPAAVADQRLRRPPGPSAREGVAGGRHKGADQRGRRPARRHQRADTQRAAARASLGRA